MTQREQTLYKHIGNDLGEVVRDAIHDAMKEHAIEFVKWKSEHHIIRGGDTQKDSWFYNNGELAAETTEQLYNKFNLNK